ncbi:MAG: hypothetical protein E7188_02525 [Erysipelotrichaceae bacterium]|nr:hypothetical protein [Erysipelotrichaceae bacterium]
MALFNWGKKKADKDKPNTTNSVAIGTVSIGRQASVAPESQRYEYVPAKNVKSNMIGSTSIEIYKDENGETKVRRSTPEIILPVAEDGHTAEDVCQYFIDRLLERGKTECELQIEQRTEDYLTVTYGVNDFLRVKYTPVAKWLSLDIIDDNKQMAIDSGLFIVPNDNRRHWQSYIRSFDDLEKYMNIAEHSCYRIPEYYEVPATPEQQVVLDRMKEIFIGAGADPEKIMFFGRSGYAIFRYKYNDIEVKVYKKKPTRLRLSKEFAKKAKIELYKADEYHGYFDLNSDDDYEALRKYAEKAVKQYEEKK